ncbi:hypothetical protein [Desulfitobacterium hafniense]|uniref:Uncharacterized protein n=1 Tax=Desulfitobacterium hafniense TaxID=49338 RepID=A0A0W1JD28_DESHA|nr:hypothetical protein [Desulfitobacterium hafniense]KTE89298.1 hypothetical protein AT727_12925 [Desulfitobacterium hafniense]
MTMHPNIGGWKNAKEGYGNINGVWRKVKEGYGNINGVWRRFFNSRRMLYTTGVQNVPWTKTPQVTWGDSYATFVAKGSSDDGREYAIIETFDIDITGFTKICVDCEWSVSREVTPGSANYSGQIYLSKPFAQLYLSINVSSARTVYTLDISAMSGINSGLCVSFSAADRNYNITATIHNIWLE